MTLKDYCHHYTDGNTEFISCYAASDEFGGAPCYFLDPRTEECRVYKLIKRCEVYG